MEWFLLFPFCLAIVAISTGDLSIKMGVPLSCALILTWILQSESKQCKDVIWVIAALIFSAAGDWFLSTKGEDIGFFIVGIALYFIAHIGYFIYAQIHGHLNVWILGTLLVIFLSYYILWLSPSITYSMLSWAVLLYLLLSCFVLASSWGMHLPARLKWPYVSGIGLIVLSDTIISFTEFLDFRMLNWLILPTYYLAHLCVSWTVIGNPKRSVSKE